ncbi:MAG: formate dehydrogenase accessory sulfurtransferase FdhD [Acidimicrobiia bacterium]
MARGRTQQLLVQHRDAGTVKRSPDDLIVEEPMEIHLDGHKVTTTMRTPGHDFELAVGFCLSDGLLAGFPVTGVRYCGTGSAVESEFNVVTVETGGRAPAPSARLTTTTSSCGLCGSDTLDTLCDRLHPIPAVEPFDYAVLDGVVDAVRMKQTLFESTGGVHAAAAFDRRGDVLVVREDIGRHNAVDKVVGRLLLDRRLPATDLALFVSGRASFEIVQKAWAVGFPLVIAVSAPSSLAVATAKAANMTLIGFARGHGRMNVYSGI